MDIQDTLLQVTKNIEKQIDATIDQLDNLDANDLETIRKNRVKELKVKQAQKQDWINSGHGEYNELKEEKMFFDIIKKSKNVVIHFYTKSNERCRIVDMHFKKLAPKHIETLFTSLNAEKCPFLTEKLKIKVIPTIVCIQNGIMTDKLVGFTTLGNRDDFTTEVMEWRLAQNEVIDYDGDLSAPPTEDNKQKNTKSIRNGTFNQEDVDLYIDDVNDKKSNQTYDLTAEELAELGINDD